MSSRERKPPGFLPALYKQYLSLALHEHPYAGVVALFGHPTSIQPLSCRLCFAERLKLGEVSHRFVNRLHRGRRRHSLGVRAVPTLGGHSAGWTGAVEAAPRRLVYLEVNAGVVLHPHDAQKRADSLGGIA